jgi:hypothetical protein
MDLLSILILIFSSISSQLLKKKITLKKSYENFPKKRIMCQNGLWSMPKENIRRLATEVSKLIRGKKFYLTQE